MDWKQVAEKVTDAVLEHYDIPLFLEMMVDGGMTDIELIELGFAHEDIETARKKVKKA